VNSRRYPFTGHLRAAARCDGRNSSRRDHQALADAVHQVRTARRRACFVRMRDLGPPSARAVGQARVPRVPGAGPQKAMVAVGRSILVITWHLLSNPATEYADLGPDFYDTRINPQLRIRAHVRQLEALGYTVTLQPAA
jgi:hypothetical protein